MSKIFYDHLLELDKVEKSIKKVSSTKEEAIELWGIVDEIIHHRVFGCVLEQLPEKHHREFLEMFHSAPGDEKLLNYLKEKIKNDITIIIKEIVAALVLEIIDNFEIKISRSKKKSSGKNYSVH